MEWTRSYQRSLHNHNLCESRQFKCTDGETCMPTCMPTWTKESFMFYSVGTSILETQKQQLYNISHGGLKRFKTPELILNLSMKSMKCVTIIL